MNKQENICPHTKKPYDCKQCPGVKWQAKGGSYHMSQSVTGPLRNWKRSLWENALTFMKRKDGTYFSTVNELKLQFQKMAEDGIQVFAVGECDNFCYKNGCQGHPVEKEDN